MISFRKTILYFLLADAIIAAAIQLVDAQGPTQTIMLDFCAQWCGPCQDMKPIVARLNREGYPVASIDVDRRKSLAARYNVTDLPCFVMIVNGREVARATGKTSYENLKGMFPVRKVPCQQGRCRGGSCQRPKVQQSPKECPYPAMVKVEFEGRGLCSGFIADVDESRHLAIVVTCAHGYAALDDVNVTTQDGRAYRALVLASDQIHDIIVLAIQDPGIKPMKIAVKPPEKGDRLFENGFAGRDVIINGEEKVIQEYSASSGTMSDWTGPTARDSTFIVCSCTAEHGCSGGPILNDRGEVVATVTLSLKDEHSVITLCGPCLCKAMRFVHFDQ
jgi:S1-C subfamily serine protease